jgi:hypothetical protein
MLKVDVTDPIIINEGLMQVLFFLLEMEKRCGATSHGCWPSSHALVQKDPLYPAPIVSVVDAAKRSLSVVLHGVSSLSLSSILADHCRHSYRNLRALANFPRWRMPKPPKHLGLAELGQLTLHFPPVNVSAPAHRNFFLCRSMSLIVFFGARRDVRK